MAIEQHNLHIPHVSITISSNTCRLQKIIYNAIHPSYINWLPMSSSCCSPFCCNTKHTKNKYNVIGPLVLSYHDTLWSVKNTTSWEILLWVNVEMSTIKTELPRNLKTLSRDCKHVYLTFWRHYFYVCGKFLHYCMITGIIGVLAQHTILVLL